MIVFLKGGIMAKIEIYSKTYCPYCIHAKNLLNKKGVSYVEYNISTDAAKEEEMMQRKPNARTVPQIFIDGVSIGGFDDMKKLNDLGQLDALIGIHAAPAQKIKP
jgi:glutaredoxin 3